MNDHELVKTCLQEICSKSGYDHFPKLSQRELEFLCDDIEEKTDILISLSTIKRLMNGQFSRLPQVATLNAITTYAGYENWQDFKLKKKNEFPEYINGNGNGHGHVALAEVKHSPLPKIRRSYKFIGLGIAVLVAIVIIAFSQFNSTASVNYDNVPFSAEKTTSNDIPNTVVFHYNIDDLEGDSFFIQQSWDINRRVRIYKKNYTLTDIYYEPGYHNAKLIVNNKMVKSVGVSIPTDKWMFYAIETVPKSMPLYIKKENFIQNGALQISKDDLPGSNIDLQKSYHYVYSFFPSKFTVPADNFILKARVRMDNVRNEPCPMIMYEVYTQHYFMYFRTTPTGCSSTNNAQFGELQLNGKIHNLSAFGTDVTKWQEVEMIVKDRQVKIYLDKKAIFENSYTQTAGMITGIGFISNGLCEVDNVSLKGLDGTVVYANQFP